VGHDETKNLAAFGKDITGSPLAGLWLATNTLISSSRTRQYTRFVEVNQIRKGG